MTFQQRSADEGEKSETVIRTVNFNELPGSGLSLWHHARSNRRLAERGMLDSYGSDKAVVINVLLTVPQVCLSTGQPSD